MMTDNKSEKEIREIQLAWLKWIKGKTSTPIVFPKLNHGYKKK